MPSNTTILRGERWTMGWAPETSYGTDPGTASYSNVFGVVQNISLSDPNIDITPIYAMGANSLRNWYVAYKGRITLNASVPDILLLNGYPLYLAMGQVATTGSSPYTHTITERVTLPSFSMHISQYDSDGSVKLMRRFIGGKVGRMSLEANEGDFLKCSLDDMSFTSYSHDQAGENQYSADVADISVSYPTTQPYLFSYGSLTLNNVEFARLRNFRLEINNSMEPRYYITDSGASQLPYEFREGKREISMSCSIDVNDASLYKELIRQGSYSNTFKGFSVTMVFARGANDTITITSPTKTPGTGGDAMGCLIRSAPHQISEAPVVTVPLNIIMRNVKITVVDSLSSYPGNTATHSAVFSTNMGLDNSIATVQA